MIGGLIGWLAGSRWGLPAARWGAVGLTVLLFLLSVRRAGARAGRMAQRLETLEGGDHSGPTRQTSIRA